VSPGEEVRGDHEHVWIGGRSLAGLGGLLGQIVVDPHDAPVRLRLDDLTLEVQLPPAPIARPTAREPVGAAHSCA
jgi:hypothetical protein